MSPEEEEESEVTCPVCGNAVALDDEFCPHCGAEFEEEEVEEIVEVEEVEPKKEVSEELFEEEIEEPEEPEAVEEAAEPEEFEEEYFEEEEVIAGDEEVAADDLSAGIAERIKDIRIIGIALLILGIIGAAIAIGIDWYWTWVPPITENLGVFSLLGILIIIIGFIGFSMMRKAAQGGKSVSSTLIIVMLGIFVFGILATIMLLMGGGINDAIASSQGGMIGVFLVLFVIGIFLFVMGQKRASTA